MKALVVVGHPAPGSFNRAIAEAIRETWAAAGCEVRFHDLVEEGFDPHLPAAEARSHRRSIRWCSGTSPSCATAIFWR